MTNRQQTLDSRQMKIFRRFLVGGILFLAGLSGVFLVNIYLPPSEKQEWFAAGLLVLGACGGLFAFVHYLWLIVIRFRHFMERK